jgi:hypothetical protein
MASTISAGTTTGTALNFTGDTSGNLAFQTGAGANTITVPNVTGTLLTNKTTGTVLQVVNATYSTLTSTTSSTYADTGLSASITPTSSSNKILVLISLNGMSKQGSSSSNSIDLQLVRNSTSIVQIDGLLGYTSNLAVQSGVSSSLNYLDSPATTSSTTYKIQFASDQNVATVYINANNARGATSTITLLEIAA